MAKKLIETGVVLLLILFSFYYTDKAISIIENKDPIMKEIKNNQKKYEKEAVNAVVHEQYVTPGYSGIMINTEKSFQKMKQYGSYSEGLLVFEEIEPTISVSDYYDKYISSGNGFTNNISLVFKVGPTDDITEIKNILDENNVRGTFFVDGVWLDEHKNEVVGLVSDFHEVEILSYDNNYDELLFTGVLDQLRILTNVKGKYCYAEYDQKEVLDLCISKKMHTIIPTMKITSNAYSSLKGKIRGGSIISFQVNQNNIKELPVVISYIKQRGYTLDTLDNLLNEGRNLEK